MIIKHITLDNYRSYGRLDLDVGPSVNIVYGNNAQGKTNLIEAINVCSCTASHRTSKDRELVKIGEEGYGIKMLCHDEIYGNDTELSASYLLENTSKNTTNKPKRELYHDNMKIERISDYIGICNTVIFAPEDLNLVKGSPSGRRKFFNMLIIKVAPSYFNILNGTNRILNQKNICIKSFKGRTDNIDNNALDFWDFSLADMSADLIMYRYRFASLLSRKAAMHHSVISGGEENLSLQYMSLTGSTELLERSLKEDGMYDRFMEGRLSEGNLSGIKRKLSDHILSKLQNSRKNDVEKGISTIGVHRDDIDIKLNGLSMRGFSSQGQQRSASLSLKLAELEIIREMVSNSPVLLLDDVFSELDAGRRTSLLAGMKEAQIFITCTDRSYIENELAAFLMTDVRPNYYRVENMTVLPED